MDELTMIDIMEEMTLEVNRLLKETDSILADRLNFVDSITEDMTNEQMVEVLTRLQAIDALLSVDYKLMSDLFAEMKSISSSMVYEIEEGYEHEEQEGWIN